MIDLLIHQRELAIKSSYCYDNLLWNIYVFHGRQQLNIISIYYHSKAIWLIFDRDETVCLTDPGKKHCRKLEFFFFYLNTCKSTISRTKPPAAMAATVIRDFVERRKDGKKKKKKREIGQEHGTRRLRSDSFQTSSPLYAPCIWAPIRDCACAWYISTAIRSVQCYFSKCSLAGDYLK